MGSCRVAELLSCEAAKLQSYRFAKLENCIVAKLQSGRATEVYGLELQSGIIAESQSHRVAEESQTRSK